MMTYLKKEQLYSMEKTGKHIKCIAVDKDSAGASTLQGHLFQSLINIVYAQTGTNADSGISLEEWTTYLCAEESTCNLSLTLFGLSPKIKTVLLLWDSYLRIPLLDGPTLEALLRAMLTRCKENKVATAEDLSVIADSLGFNHVWERDAGTDNNDDNAGHCWRLCTDDADSVFVYGVRDIAAYPPPGLWGEENVLPVLASVQNWIANNIEKPAQMEEDVVTEEHLKIPQPASTIALNDYP